MLDRCITCTRSRCLNIPLVCPKLVRICNAYCAIDIRVGCVAAVAGKSPKERLSPHASAIVPKSPMARPNNRRSQINAFKGNRWIITAYRLPRIKVLALPTVSFKERFRRQILGGYSNSKKEGEARKVTIRIEFWKAIGNSKLLGAEYVEKIRRESKGKRFGKSNFAWDAIPDSEFRISNTLLF